MESKMGAIKANLERVTRDVNDLAKIITPHEIGFTRISFSKEDRRARKHVARLMEEEANLTISIDDAGNLIGRRQGKRKAPSIVIGSHIDTVRGGGRFDGTAGVVAGLEIARLFKEKHIETIHPIEVVIFLAEEPSPFGISTIGSRGMAGKLSEDLLGSLKDDEGRNLGKAIEMMGGNPAKIIEAKRSSNDIRVFLELHVEQGPILFSKKIPMGVVTGICGIHRGKVEVMGKCDHSGTTPMEVRNDALTAASEVILALEKICRQLDEVVGTIGRIEIFPNSSNVVPGNVTLIMEVRSLVDSMAMEAVSLFRKALKKIEEERGTIIQFESEISSNPVVFNSKMVKLIVGACKRCHISYQEMSSGAGHDASHMASMAPTGMIFIPSKDGKSHCPEEWSKFEHICLGAEVLAETILMIDREETV